MDSFLVYFYICCSLIVNSDKVTLKFEMTSNIIVKGASLEFSCSVSESFNAIDIRKEHSRITACRKQNDCNFYRDRFSFTSNTSGVFGCIRNVSTEDQGIWQCNYSLPQGGYIFSNNWNLSVYTIPTGLSITQNPDKDVDLSVNPVVLQCKTIGCTYPMPTVKWIFKGRITSLENIYAVENATAIEMECSAQEMIYTSTLQLPLYTTINESSDKTGTFYCRMEYHDTFWNINSSASQTVRFTAHVRSITLEPSGNIITSLDGNNASLRCTTGPSRPAPVIRWWVDGNEVTNHSITKITDTSDFFMASSELHLNIERTHQGKTVYCDARVSSQDNVKESMKPAINVCYAPDVRVNISESTLVGLTAVLMCTAQGEPPQYTFHSWIHRVGQTEIRRLNGVNTDSISILTLSNISIQDMGSYICTVDNSITGLDGHVYQKGHTSLYVEGPPHFGKTGSTFKGETGKSAIIKIPFYSSSPNITMKIKKNSDSCEMSNTSGVTIYVSPSEITMTFYTKKVMIPGHVAVLNYTNVTDGDFDNYRIHLSNKQGHVTMEFAFLGSTKVNTKLTDIDIEVVAGGIGIGVVLIAAMLFICCYRVKEKMFKCTLKRGHDFHTYENTEMGLQPVQPTYEELKKENVEQDTYDKISSLNVCCSI